MTITVGVLALQGDVCEHMASLEAVGVKATRVRRPEDLARIDGLVIPGGESTTIEKLLNIFELFDPLQAALRGGLPAYGSCAGMILLANNLVDGASGQQTLGGIDMTVRRNAFGRQIDSFETEISMAGITGPPLRSVFIRAPWVESVGPGVEVLATVTSEQPSEGPTSPLARIVAVRSGSLLATSFHPEITGDTRVHQLFVSYISKEF